MIEEVPEGNLSQQPLSQHSKGHPHALSLNLRHLGRVCYKGPDSSFNGFDGVVFRERRDHILSVEAPRERWSPIEFCLPTRRACDQEPNPDSSLIEQFLDILNLL